MLLWMALVPKLRKFLLHGRNAETATATRRRRCGGCCGRISRKEEEPLFEQDLGFELAIVGASSAMQPTVGELCFSIWLYFSKVRVRSQIWHLELPRRLPIKLPRRLPPSDRESRPVGACSVSLIQKPYR